jgi:hypothetical protein
MTGGLQLVRLNSWPNDLHEGYLDVTGHCAVPRVPLHYIWRDLWPEARTGSSPEGRGWAHTPVVGWLTQQSLVRQCPHVLRATCVEGYVC